ncbi:MAG: efflux RND transporter periplasmic adaptor subunit [Desulfuromonadia bacterium]
MKKIAIPIILVALAASIYLFTRQKTPTVTYTTLPVERGSITATVAATGTLSAVTTVQVGTQVSGTIKALHVDYNSRVRKGDILAELDPSLFRAAVEQARGNLLVAEAQLAKAKTTLADAKRTLERNRRLLSSGIISQADFDLSETSHESALAQVRSADGSVTQAKGALAQAETNLKNSVIRSPVDGVVISRSIDVGQTVAASFQTPTLFTIARDLTKMQIEVSVDEADISKVKVGQTSRFSVDAYPERKFTGTVVQVRSAPVVTQNVVTYVVVVSVDNRELLLKPGMTANVSIETARRDDVLTILMAALRFRPQPTGATKDRPHSAMEKGTRGERKSPRSQKVYLLKEGKPVPVEIVTGISDGSRVELVSGEVKEGDPVIVEQSGGTKERKKSGSPMGSPMGPVRPH